MLLQLQSAVTVLW